MNKSVLYMDYPRRISAAVGYRIIVCLWFAGVFCSAAVGDQNIKRWMDKPDEWFRSAAGRRVADNILSWQSRQGSWPKNADTTKKYSADPAALQGTFDNGATTPEMRFLARAFCATKDRRYERAFLRGLDHILEAQYPSGGWPQFYPPSTQYHRYITFNDGTMIRLMELLRDIITQDDYDFIDAVRRKAVRDAFRRGVDCILKCQIRVNGKLTVWCAQHDEIDYRPRPGRTYELVSLSGAESAGIVRFLMSLDQPNSEIIRAVQAGAEWFESARLNGIRLKRINGDKVIVEDPNAGPLWARFYEIETNRPIFSGRDGVKRYNLAEIEQERRRSYAWYGDWGVSVARAYARWKKKWLR